MSKHKTRVTKLTVTPGELFHERGFEVEIVDEAGGEFIQVRSNDTGKLIQIDVDEWPFLRDAIDRMFVEIAENEEKPEPPKEEDGWIPWNGGACPVPGDACVFYRTRDLWCSRDIASNLRWSHDGSDGDIIAYKVVD